MSRIDCFKKLIAVFSVAGILVSCGKDKPNEQDEVNFNSSIQGLLKVSGADGNVWDAGDAIGIYMKNAGAALSSSTMVSGANNRKYATTAGGANVSFAPQSGSIYFPEDGNVDFIAYYPHGNVNGDFNMNIDVTNQTSQKDVMFMYSANATSQSKANKDVALSFGHVMSKFVLNVEAETVNGLKAEIAGVKTKSVFSIADGSLTDDQTSAGTIEALTTVKSATTATIEAILLPATNLTGATIKFTLGSKAYVWNIPVANYESGKKYTYNFNLNAISSSEVFLDATGSIVPWNNVPPVNVNFSDITVISSGNPGDREQILLERFGSLSQTEFQTALGITANNTSVANFVSKELFDMKAPIAYRCAFSRADIRVTSTLASHTWLPANNDAEFEVSGLPADMTSILLSFDMMSNGAGKPANQIQIRCNGNLMSSTGSNMDTHTFTSTNATGLVRFEFTVPDGTTTVGFFGAAGKNDTGFRIANIKIEAIKAQ